MGNAIDRLLSPTTYGYFIERTRGREYLLAQGDPARFEDLFQWDAIEKLLSTHKGLVDRLKSDLTLRKGISFIEFALSPNGQERREEYPPPFFFTRKSLHETLRY